jgi:hypothetical protein
MHPDGSAMQKVPDASAEPLHQRAGALDRVAGDIDYDFRVQLRDAILEAGLLPVRSDARDLRPCRMRRVRLSLAAAHANDFVSGFRQARRKVGADVSGPSDHRDAHLPCNTTPGRRSSPPRIAASCRRIPTGACTVAAIASRSTATGRRARSASLCPSITMARAPAPGPSCCRM